MINFETIKFNRKLRWRLIIYVIIVGTYIGIAAHATQQWRHNCIEKSPIVYFTCTGEKYHKAYHYHERNYPISLFEASEKKYTRCRICNPPIVPDYKGKPKFYLFNWVLISLGISLSYWLIIKQLNKK
jgi:hypothetical protein